MHKCFETHCIKSLLIELSVVRGGCWWMMVAPRIIVSAIVLGLWF